MENQAILNTVRGADSVFRYGGEEFLALLPRTNSAQALVAAERLRQVIEAQTEVTVSLGIAASQIPLEGNMIERADKALYQAKRNGRNRVEVWNEEKEGSSGVLIQEKAQERPGHAAQAGARPQWTNRS